MSAHCDVVLVLDDANSKYRYDTLIVIGFDRARNCQRFLFYKSNLRVRPCL